MCFGRAANSARYNSKTLPVEVSPELRQYAMDVLKEACEHYPLGYTPELQWRNLRVTAGTAYYKEGRIVLSAIVLNTPERLRTTLLHEYAHLLAYKRKGRRGTGHGLAWREAMAQLGLAPERTHNYEVDRNKPRQRVTYACLKCGRSLVRKRKLPSRRKYVHAHCGGALRLQSVERVTAVDNAS